MRKSACERKMRHRDAIGIDRYEKAPPRSGFASMPFAGTTNVGDVK